MSLRDQVTEALAGVLRRRHAIWHARREGDVDGAAALADQARLEGERFAYMQVLKWIQKEKDDGSLGRPSDIRSEASEVGVHLCPVAVWTVRQSVDVPPLGLVVMICGYRWRGPRPEVDDTEVEHVCARQPDHDGDHKCACTAFRERP